jgi:hypothetical protein
MVKSDFVLQAYKVRATVTPKVRNAAANTIYANIDIY